ncbi:hypothetical protein BDW22DRAFT_1304455, partial [Trametopsis cervina]
LGLKPPRTVLTLDDYQAYVIQRDEFLKSPRGPTALLKGGIVWRLAIGTASIRTLCIGPESDRTVQETSLRGTTYIEDELSIQELDIVVGTYRILTHRSHAAMQGSFVSWWPPHDIWQMSGVQMGYWTLENESWYQNRLLKIRDNTAKHFTRHQWLSEL